MASLIGIHPGIAAQRLKEQEYKINAIAKKMDPNAPHITAVMGKELTSIPWANGDRRVISLPYLFLLKASDLRKEYQSLKIDDPMLQEDIYLDSFGVRAQKFFNLPKKSLDFIDKQIIRTFLQYISNPALAEKAKDFVLGHEVAHIMNQHDHNSADPIAMLVESAFSGSTALANATIFAIAIATGLWTTMPLVVLSCATAATTTTVGYRIIQESNHSHACEKDADLTSARHVKNAKEGGVYLFETFMKCQKNAREHSFLYRLLFNSDGDTRVLWLTHPYESERASYLKQFKN